MEVKPCKGNHKWGTVVKAVPESGEHQLCRRHWNRYQQDERIREFRENGPRCPAHPDRIPRVSRWESQARPVLSCTAPTGEKIFTRATGRGVFRIPAATTYASFCEWTAEIPDEVIKGEKQGSK